MSTGTGPNSSSHRQEGRGAGREHFRGTSFFYDLKLYINSNTVLTRVGEKYRRPLKINFSTYILQKLKCCLYRDLSKEMFKKKCSNSMNK